MACSFLMTTSICGSPSGIVIERTRIRRRDCAVLSRSCLAAANCNRAQGMCRIYDWPHCTACLPAQARKWPSRMYLSFPNAFEEACGPFSTDCSDFFSSVYPLDGSPFARWVLTPSVDDNTGGKIQHLDAALTAACDEPCFSIAGSYVCRPTISLPLVHTFSGYVLPGYQIDPFWGFFDQGSTALLLLVSEYDPNSMGPQPVLSPFQGEVLPDSATVTLTMTSGTPVVGERFNGEWALAYDRGAWNNGGGGSGGTIPCISLHLSHVPDSLPNLHLSYGSCSGGGVADSLDDPLTWTDTISVGCPDGTGVFSATVEF